MNCTFICNIGLDKNGFLTQRFNFRCVASSWSPVSLNLTDLVATLPNHKVGWLRTCDYGYDYTGGIWDRTAGPAEAHIEVMVIKESSGQG